MKQGFARTFAALTIISIIAVHSATAQKNVILVTGKPFKVVSNDSIFYGLQSKLPWFVCNGIFFNSSLKFQYLKLPNGSSADYSDINYQTRETDPVFNDKYRELMSASKVQFFIEGEIVINREQFYITVNGTDFKRPLIPFKSAVSSLSQFQAAIDNACENINSQIQLRIAGNSAKAVQVNDFKIIYGKGYDSKQVEMSGDFPNVNQFPARYLAYNLHNSSSYQILPYQTSSLKSKGTSSLDPVEAYLTVSGEVTLGKAGKATIKPILYLENDSLILQNVEGNIHNENPLLKNTLSIVQTALNIIVDSGQFKFEKLAEVNNSTYKKLYDEALSKNQFEIALFYANQLSNSRGSGASEGVLLRGKLHALQNKVDEALPDLLDYLRENEANDEANYYAGLCYLRKRNYPSAKTHFNRIKSSYQDVFFQKGMCFYQDSTKEALNEFQKQIKANDKANPSAYLYAALCLTKLNQWNEAEKYAVKYTQSEPTSATNKKYSAFFYSEYARHEYDSGRYEKAYQYFDRSYQLSRANESLSRAVMCYVKLGYPIQRINELVNTGISDSVFNRSTVYLNLAFRCMSERDVSGNYIVANLKAAILFYKTQYSIFKANEVFSSMGSAFFRMNEYDSAEKYYQKAMNFRDDSPIAYFDLVEAQVMQLKLESALSNLKEAGRRFGYDEAVKRGAPPFEMVLYNFFLIEAKILAKQDTRSERKVIDDLLDNHPETVATLFSRWSFKTFYNWVKSGPNLTDDQRKGLMDKLCLIVLLSKEKNYYSDCAGN